MTPELTPGSELAGYRIESLLKRGGMSVVYLADHLRLGRKAVLKVLAPELAMDASFRERFVRESQVAAGLEHPHIVPIYEAGEADGYLFIAMRYVRGTDLDAVIRSDGSLDPARAVSIVGQVAGALDAAHAEGLVHRDVKPANVLLAPGTGADRDHAYLTDFGITKRLSPGSATTTGQVMGSVDYIAPEQIEGHGIDGRADVYSLGCVLYRSLTGEVPFLRPNELAVLWAHVREEPPKPSAVRPGLPKAMDDVTTKAMAKSPEGRYPTAGELASAAAQAIGDRTVVLPRLPRRIPGSRRRRWWIAAAIVLLAGVAAGVFIATRGGSGPSPADFPASLWRIDTVHDSGSAVAGIERLDAADFAAGEGALWVATPHAVVRINEDASDHEVTRIPATSPRAIAVGAGQVWALGGQAAGPNASLLQIDPAVNGLVHETELQTPAVALVVGPGAVWLLSSDGTLLRYNPVKRKITGRIPVGAGANDLALGPANVWVVNATARTLTAVSISTGTAGTPKRLPVRPGAVAAGEGAVWVVDTNAGTVLPVDPVTLAPGTQISIGGHPFEITTGDRSVWVATSSSVFRILKGTAGAIPIRIRGSVLDLASEHTQGRPEDERKIWVLVSNPR